MSKVFDTVVSSFRALMQFRPRTFPWGQLFQLRGEEPFERPKEILSTYCWTAVASSVVMFLLAAVWSLRLGFWGLIAAIGGLVGGLVTAIIPVGFLIWLKNTKRETWPAVWYSIAVVLWLLQAISLLQSIFGLLTAFRVGVYTLAIRAVTLIFTLLYFAILYNFVEDFQTLASHNLGYQDTPDDNIIDNELPSTKVQQDMYPPCNEDIILDDAHFEQPQTPPMPQSQYAPPKQPPMYQQPEQPIYQQPPMQPGYHQPPMRPQQMYQQPMQPQQMYQQPVPPPGMYQQPMQPQQMHQQPMQPQQMYQQPEPPQTPYMPQPQEMYQPPMQQMKRRQEVFLQTPASQQPQVPPELQHELRYEPTQPMWQMPQQGGNPMPYVGTGVEPMPQPGMPPMLEQYPSQFEPPMPSTFEGDNDMNLPLF